MDSAQCTNSTTIHHLEVQIIVENMKPRRSVLSQVCRRGVVGLCLSGEQRSDHRQVQGRRPRRKKWVAPAAVDQALQSPAHWRPAVESSRYFAESTTTAQRSTSAGATWTTTSTRRTTKSTRSEAAAAATSRHRRPTTTATGTPASDDRRRLSTAAGRSSGSGRRRRRRTRWHSAGPQCRSKRPVATD